MGKTTPDELARGTLFAGRYEIIEELGAGGMGRVYRAHDTKLNEEVALKLIKPEIAADKRTAERFRNELKVARKIRHKNVPGMYDFHEEGKTLFLTMEYVRGEDLKSLIHRTKTLSVGTALAVTRQIAEGLGEAHKLGITHRDLKPGNVMIDKDGQAKVMDFGIARSLHGGGITAEGGIIGTPEYMSPEQVEGKPADPRADIYALGIILFEKVTGRVPFEGETAFAIANKHKSEPPPIPKKIAPQIPESLSRLILRCLEKDKAKRYQTTEELIVDLDGIEQALPTAERVTPKRKTITHREVTVKFQPQKLVLRAAAVLVLAMGGFLLWIKVINPPSPPLLAAKPTLALLPIRNSSGDATLDKWKEILPVLLNGGLSQSRYLVVLEDYQVYSALKKLSLVGSDKYTVEKLKNIAADRGATHLLSGEYLGAGAKFIIILRLIDAKTGAAIEAIQEKIPNWDTIIPSMDPLVKKIKMALNIPEQDIDRSTYRMVGDHYTRNMEALQYYIEGEKAHQNYEYNRAFPALERAIALDPGFAMAFRTLGVCYGNRKNFIKSIQNLGKALDLRAKLPEKDRLLIEGTWFAQRGETIPKAYATFKKVVERYPEDYQGRFNLAYFSDDPDEKIREYEYLVNSQGQRPSELLMHKLVTSYGIKEDYKKARETFEEYSKSAPPCAAPHIRLGWLLQFEKNHDAARREYEKAIVANPDDLGCKIYMHNIDWAQENPDKAIQTYNTGFAVEKDLAARASWFGALSRLLLETGEFGEALALGEKSEKSILTQGGTVISLSIGFMTSGTTLLQIGDAEKALEKFRAGLEYIRKEESQLRESGLEALMHNKRLLMIWQVCALCDLGRIEEAELIQKELESLTPKYIKKGWKRCLCLNVAFSAGKIALAKKDAAAAIMKLEESFLYLPGEDPYVAWDDLRHTESTGHAYLFDLLGDA